MDSSGHFNEWHAPSDAPVFLTIAHQKGAKSSQENKEGEKTTGKAECSTLKGKVLRWSGVGEPGKASDQENRHPLQYTVERYEKGANGYSLLEEKKEEVETEQEVLESTCSNQGGYCGESRQDKGKGRNIDWGPTSILPGTSFQLVERQKQKGKEGRIPYILGRRGWGEFLGEDARKMGEVETKNAWELILDNIPKERVSVWGNGSG